MEDENLDIEFIEPSETQHRSEVLASLRKTTATKLPSRASSGPIKMRPPRPVNPLTFRKMVKVPSIIGTSKITGFRRSAQVVAKATPASNAVAANTTAGALLLGKRPVMSRLRTFKCTDCEFQCILSPVTITQHMAKVHGKQMRITNLHNPCS